MAIQECYSCLSLVLAMDFCSVNIFLYISYSKKTQKYITKKTMKYSEKNEFIEKRWGGPSFKLWGGSRVPFLNFEGVQWSRVLAAWSHFYTMPSNSSKPIKLAHLENLTNQLMLNDALIFDGERNLSTGKIQKMMKLYFLKLMLIDFG